MKPRVLRERMHDEERTVFIEWLAGSPVYVDESDLCAKGTALPHPTDVHDLIAWYRATGGYVGPGRRYLTATLRAGVHSLWDVAP